MKISHLYGRPFLKHCLRVKPVEKMLSINLNGKEV